MARLICLLILLPVMVSAQTDINQSSIEDSNSVGSNFDQSSLWGISTEEWTRYRKIMTGQGKFLYPDLDPITVLGLSARTTQERERFAELLAKLEFEKTRNLILLDQAYNKAFAKLYGHLPIVDLGKLNLAQAKTDFRQPSQIEGQPGDRYIFFASTRCTECTEVVKSLLSQLLLDVQIDIHFKNDTRTQIMEWARSMSISPKAVELGSISLNPSSDLYAKFGNPEPPALYFFDKSTNQVSEVR